MTALTDPPRTKKGTQTVLGGLPQVNLLPPEVRAARGLRSLKRLLAVVLVVVLGLCIGVFALAKLSQSAADDELASAKKETARLQAEQAKYAEVPRVLTALSDAQTARKIGMSTDVPWSAYYAAVTAVLPADVSIGVLTTTVATPMTAPSGAANPLQKSSVGQIQFTGRSTTVPNTAAWIDALNSVPGFSDAWASSATLAESPSKTVYYEVQVSVQVTSDAFSHRFDTIKQEG